MNKLWGDLAWEHYLYWQNEDRKTLKKINNLIQDIERNGKDKGLGKPEKLKHKDGWSRRIDESNSLVYDVDEQGYLHILACKGHYN